MSSVVRTAPARRFFVHRLVSTVLTKIPFTSVIFIEKEFFSFDELIFSVMGGDTLVLCMVKCSEKNRFRSLFFLW